jgi:hypothetical protein
MKQRNAALRSSPAALARAPKLPPIVSSPRRAAQLCPKCEGPMVFRRRAADGREFLGCTRYPICTATRSLPKPS